MGEIGARPVGDLSESRGEGQRGWVASQPGAGLRPGPPPRNGGGQRRGRGTHSRAGPRPWRPAAGAPSRTLPGPRSHAVLNQHTRRPHARPKRAQGRLASPSPTSLFLRAKLPHRRACPSCSVPWMPPRMRAHLGTGRKVPNAQVRRVREPYHLSGQ